jgi:hypothetical protein
MATITEIPTPLQRAAQVNQVLAIWARAFGCSAGEVTNVVRRAGLPMEKLWNSISAGVHQEAA